jgi:hypothetical protein
LFGNSEQLQQTVRPTKYGKNHVSMASIRRREQEVENMVWEWRTQQVEAAEKRLGYVEGDQFVPFEHERLEEVRQELRGMCE